MQDEGSDAINQQDVPAGTPPPGGKGFGRGLLDLAKASAREAGRGAHLASLKTQMEKLKRMDLANALAALGAKAYELKALADKCGPLYAEIDAIDENIKVKRAGVDANEDAGFAGKAKAKAISIKLGAEAEALAHKRKNKCGEIGRIIVDGNAAVDGLAAEIQAVAEVQRRIDDLDKQLAVVADDRTGRDAFASSARSLGADAKAASKSPIWKKPVVWGGMVAVLLVAAAVVFIKGGGRGDQAPQAAKEDAPSRWAAGYGGSQQNLVAGWGVALREIEKVKNFGRYTSVQRSTAFQELWDRALVLEHKPNVRSLFLKFPDGLKYKVVNVKDQSGDGTPCLIVKLEPADPASEEKIREAEKKISEGASFSMGMVSPVLVALLNDKQMRNLNRGDEIRSDGWTLAVALGRNQDINADIVFRKDSEYVTIINMLGSSL